MSLALLLAAGVFACTTASESTPDGPGTCVDGDCAEGANDPLEPEEDEPEQDGAAEDGPADAGTKSKADGGAKKDAGKPKPPPAKDAGTDGATPPPPPPVGGATVAECQGETAISVDFGKKPLPSFKTGFAIYTQGHYEVYFYSRPLISDYAYGGNAGELKGRLILGGPTGNSNEYQGLFGVSEWSVAQGKWVNLATPTEVTIVTIANYQLVDPTGLMCNGQLAGTLQALFGAATVAVAAFDVPILTTSFPKSNPGPP